MASGESAMRRSEAVRARRMRQRAAGKPTQRRSGRSRRRDIPRMVARNPQVERRLNRGRQVRERRRVQVNLATEGAELNLPALPAIRFGWRVLSGLLAAGMLFALYLLWSAPMFTVSRAELRGAARLSAQDVNRVLGVAGLSIFEIRPQALTDLLASEFPELRDFDLSIGFPARVIVKADERQPMLAWEQSGITVWVDQAGVAFIPEGEAEGLVNVKAEEAPPALEGAAYARHQLVRPEMVSAILALSEHAPQDATLLYDPRLGFGWQDPEGWQAFFGAEASDIEQRLAVYQRILAQLSERNLKPTLISVAHLHAPYYRLDY